MKRKFKFIIILFNSIVLTLSSLNPLSKGKVVNSIANDYTQVIQETKDSYKLSNSKFFF